MAIGLAKGEIFSFLLTMWPHVTTWSEVSCDMGEFLSLEVTILSSCGTVYILFLACDYLAKFGNHRHCKRRDARLSFWHVTSRDDIVKGSCVIMVDIMSSPHHKSLPCQVW